MVERSPEVLASEAKAPTTFELTLSFTLPVQAPGYSSDNTDLS